MNSADARLCVSTLAATFCRWKAEPAELDAWADNVFARLPDLEMAKRAIGEYFASARYSTPAPGDYRAVYARLDGQARPREAQGQDLAWNSGYGVQCVEAPPAFPGRLWWTQWLMFPRQPDIPPNSSTLYALADKTREQYQALYGGRWQIVTDDRR